MDATKMTFPDSSFDFVIDKGTLDALACGNETQISSALLKEM
jgi:hypothetical protein